MQYPVSLAAASNDDNFTGAVSGLPRVWTFEEEVWGIKYGAGYKFGLWDAGEGIAGSDLILIPWLGVFGFTMTGQWDSIPTGVSPCGNTKGTFQFNTPMVGLGTRSDLSERWYTNLSSGP